MKEKQNRIYIVDPGPMGGEVMVDLESVIGISGIQGSYTSVEFTIKLINGEVYVILECGTMSTLDSKKKLWDVKMKLCQAWSDYCREEWDRNQSIAFHSSKDAD